MKSKSILIVDDNDLNRKLFENLISQSWYCETARNGLEALEKLKYQSFDLILIDIQMPELDGISAMKLIRSHELADCPIIAITAYADESDRETFLSQGFDEFMVKPIRPREFLNLIQNTLDSKNLPEEESEEKTLQKNILDREVFEQLTKYNNPEMIKQVYLDFLQECDQLIKKSKIAYESKNLEDLSNSIHILKGNSGTLGANRIFLAAQTLELSGRKGSLEEIPKQLNQLEEEIQSFKQYLNQATIFEL